MKSKSILPGKKKFLALFICMTVSTIVMAQREHTNQFSFGPELGWATSNPFSNMAENKGWGLGAGGSVQFQRFVKENLTLGIEAGIITYAGRSAGADVNNKGYTIIPVRLTGSVYLGQLHLGAQIGAGFNTLAGKSITTFSYSPQIGYSFTRNEVPLDFTLHYDGYAGHGGFSALMLRLALIL